MTQITIARYEEHEMAYVLLDGSVVFSGNDWDFHSGCMGTVIAGHELAGLWDRGIESLAAALALAIERSGTQTQIESIALDDAAYVKLGGFVD